MRIARFSHNDAIRFGIVDEGELVVLAGDPMFAGYDTTRNQLGLAMFTFAQHRDQWALLAKEPELAPKAVAT